MREQTGVIFIAIGAALVWALDVEIPYVHERGLGWVLMVVGAIAIVTAVVQAAMHIRFGFGLGLALFTLGALFAFVIDVDIPYVLEDELGAILALAGLITIAAQGAMAAQRQRPRRPREQRPRRDSGQVGEPRGYSHHQGYQDQHGYRQQQGYGEQPPAPPRDDRYGPPTQKLRPWKR